MFTSRQKLNADHDALIRVHHAKLYIQLQEGVYTKIVIFCQLIRKELSDFHKELHEVLQRSKERVPNYDGVFETGIFSTHFHFKFLVDTGLVYRSPRGYFPHGALGRYLDYYEREIRKRGPSLLVPAETDEEEAAPSFQACNQQ